MGVLSGVRVVEMSSIGPTPFCGMLLADMGAAITRIDPPADAAAAGSLLPPRYHVTARGRRSIALDLKGGEGRAIALKLIDRADLLIEGYRPGVMERLGLGPDPCLQRNPRLVYGRMTGWGQNGPLAALAGHDINYIAMAGALHGIGEADRGPVPPLNLVGDFGGGGAYLCIGMLAALLEARQSGKGQVVDAAIVDGTASLMAQFHGRVAHGDWLERRGANAFDSGSHFYNVYETADGEHVAVGAVEGKFYRELLDGLGLADDPDFRDRQMDRAAWPRLKARMAAIFRTRTRAQWCQAMAGRDACFTPVLRIGEAPGDPHAQARRAYVDVGGIIQPAPAPRFSRTPSAVGSAAPRPGADSAIILAELGYDDAQIAALRGAGDIVISE